MTTSYSQDRIKPNENENNSLDSKLVSRISATKTRERSPMFDSMFENAEKIAGRQLFAQ